MVDEVNGVVVSDELGVEDDGCCPEHNWDDEGNDDADVVLPLDFVVGLTTEHRWPAVRRQVVVVV